MSSLSEKGFEVGKSYRHSSGRLLHVIMERDTLFFGRTLIAEDSAGELVPVSRDPEAMVGWEEIPIEETRGRIHEELAGPRIPKQADMKKFWRYCLQSGLSGPCRWTDWMDTPPDKFEVVLSHELVGVQEKWFEMRGVESDE